MNCFDRYSCIGFIALGALIGGILGKFIENYIKLQNTPTKTSIEIPSFKKDNSILDSLSNIIHKQDSVILELHKDKERVDVKIHTTLFLPIVKESKKEAIQWAITHSTK